MNYYGEEINSSSNSDLFFNCSGTTAGPVGLNLVKGLQSLQKGPIKIGIFLLAKNKFLFKTNIYYILYGIRSYILFVFVGFFL